MIRNYSVDIILWS